MSITLQPEHERLIAEGLRSAPMVMLSGESVYKAVWGGSVRVLKVLLPIAVYDREGHLVAQAIDRPALRGFLDMLAQAGLQ